MHRPSPSSLLLPLSCEESYRSVLLDGSPEIWKVHYVRSPQRITWLPASLILGFHTSLIWCLAVLLPLLTSPPVESRHSATICLTLQQPNHLKKERKREMTDDGGRKKIAFQQSLQLCFTVRFLIISFNMDIWI